MERRLRLSEPEYTCGKCLFWALQKTWSSYNTKVPCRWSHTNGMRQQALYHRAKWQWTSSPREIPTSSSRPLDSNQNPAKWRWSNMMKSSNSMDLTSQVSQQVNKQETQLYMSFRLFTLALRARSSTSFPSLRTLSGMHCHRGYRCQVNQWHGSKCSSSVNQREEVPGPSVHETSSSVITSLTICHIEGKTRFRGYTE